MLNVIQSHILIKLESWSLQINITVQDVKGEKAAECSNDLFIKNTIIHAQMQVYDILQKN
jgi:hypothetical protein